MYKHEAADQDWDIWTTSNDWHKSEVSEDWQVIEKSSSDGYVKG